jgi:hypothetical protein
LTNERDSVATNWTKHEAKTVLRYSPANPRSGDSQC